MDDNLSVVMGWNWKASEEKRENMWNWAIHYLDLGWNIMPIEAAGKKPRLYKWEHLIQERVNPDTVDEWWKEWPHANIALICGQISDIICLDVDDSQAFNHSDLPITAKSQTSRGHHYFFRYPKPGPFPSFKGKGYDLQSDGKYVILPPSEHKSGAFYTWLIDPWRELEPFANPPSWLLGDGEREGWGNPSGNGGTIKPLFSMNNFLEGVGEGERNNAAARLAGHLFKQDREYDDVLCTLQGWNLRNRPPLHPREIVTVINSVYKKHGGKP